MSRHARRTLFAAGLLAVCLPLTACQFKMPQADAAAESDSLRVPRALVRVATPVRAPIQKRVRATGNLEPRDYVDIFPESLGKVAQVRVELRSPVQAGDTLAVLESNEQRLATLTAIEKVRRLEAIEARQEGLLARGGLGIDALEETRNSLSLARIEAERSQLAWSKTTLISPISGVVTFEDIRAGEVLSQRRIFKIEDLSELLVKLYIPERDLPSLRLEQPVEILHFSQTNPYDARVDLIAPTLDPDSGTGEVHVALDAPAELRVGYFVSAEIIVEDRTDALLVPKKAVLREPGGNFLVLALPEAPAPTDSLAMAPGNEPERFARALRVEVELGLEDAQRAEILGLIGKLPEGLGLEDVQVVVEGQYGLLDDTALKLVD